MDIFTSSDYISAHALGVQLEPMITPSMPGWMDARNAGELAEANHTVDVLLNMVNRQFVQINDLNKENKELRRDTTRLWIAFTVALVLLVIEGGRHL